jgi:UDP-glucose 4-epimerase
VFASSSAVYGDDPEMPKRETMTPAPISPYASSKLAGEQLCQVFTAAYGLEAVTLRYFNVFGPGQDPNSAYAAVIPKFLDAIGRGETPRVFGDGEQSRDFVFIDDVVNANLLAAEHPAAPGKVFNIASGHAVTLNQTLTLFGAAMGTVVGADYLPERAGDVRHSLADISYARAVLGFEPAVSFEEGLRRTIAGNRIGAVAG